MNISDFMSKKDFISIFIACVLILFVVALVMISKAIGWIFIIILLIVGGFSFYMAFGKKHRETEEEEFSGALGEMKDLFGGKKNV
jgi:Flp pilus assembly protein TadB